MSKSKDDYLAKPFRVAHGKDFRLSDFPTAPPEAVDVKKKKAKSLIDDGVDQLTALQEKLYADNRWSVLLIFQAIDAAGKDGTIKHVMSGVNPQGCQVHSFKAPGPEELAHDFLWRTTYRLPERGRIGIFNRSYYEEVLITRIHPEILDKQNLPEACQGKNFWDHRYESIVDFEKHIARNGTLVIKFYLNLSPEEQRRRLVARIDEPAKNWKFDVHDLAERDRWKDYMRCYQDMIKKTAGKHAPWYVIPADDKWFMRTAVLSAIVHEMEKLDLAFPEVSDEVKAKLLEARQSLTRD